MCCLACIGQVLEVSVNIMEATSIPPHTCALYDVASGMPGQSAIHCQSLLLCLFHARTRRCTLQALCWFKPAHCAWHALRQCLPARYPLHTQRYTAVCMHDRVATRR